MTITTKTTKKGLVEFIKDSAPKLTGKDMKALADSVAYTMKKFAEDANQVLKDDLYLLAQDIQNVLGSIAPAPAPVENSIKLAVKKEEVPPTEETAPAPTKPTLGGKKNKNTAPKVDDETRKQAEEILKTATGKKTTDAKNEDKKTEEKKPTVPAKPKLVQQKPVVNEVKQVVLAQQFPEEFVADGVGKLKVITDGIKTMKDVYELINAGKNLIFAMYWTKRHFSQFPYDNYGINKKVFKEVPNDLDLAQLVYVSEEHKVAYAVSAYSEVMYTVLPSNLEMSEGMRFTSGIEFNIYEVIE